MYCKNCGQQVSENVDFCMHCGSALKEQNASNVNFNGQNQNASNVNFNGQNQNASNGKLNGQDKIVMILICLFLGGIGIHNFMMGETKKGIFKIIMCFVCGISAIFALIDLIKIATDSYVVDTEKYI